MRRGNFIAVAMSGAYGKPRPALVVQSDMFAALPSVTFCPLSSLVRDDADLFRLTVEPSASNGLRHMSQILVDKITTLPHDKIGQIIGHADDTLMLRVNQALALFFGIA